MITTDQHLRYIADAYEQAQRVRIAQGERIRAVLQQRDETWTTPDDTPDVDMVLESIVRGDVGPVPSLGRTYRRFYEEEVDLRRDMMATLKKHSVWLHWLKDVRGIGPTLGCKLLATLDPERADSPSAFWKFCGLSTVPGERYRCETCGLVRAWPVGYNVTGKHSGCTGLLERVPGDDVRVAERATAGEKSPYSRQAKKLLYLVGTSFIKAGGPYEQYYRRHRVRLDVERPGWTDGRKHLTALRIMEKLFLSHLWEVWREELELPVRRSYAEQHLGHDGYISPWKYVASRT